MVLCNFVMGVEGAVGVGRIGQCRIPAVAPWGCHSYSALSVPF